MLALEIFFTLDCQGQDGDTTQAVIDIDWDTTSFAASSCSSTTCCPGTEDCTVLVITTHLYMKITTETTLRACNGQTLCNVRAVPCFQLDTAVAVSQTTRSWRRPTDAFVQTSQVPTVL